MPRETSPRARAKMAVEVERAKAKEIKKSTMGKGKNSSKGQDGGKSGQKSQKGDERARGRTPQ